jgi:hypothetical protein
VHGAGGIPARHRLRVAQIQNTSPTSELISSGEPAGRRRWTTAIFRGSTWLGWPGAIAGRAGRYTGRSVKEILWTLKPSVPPRGRMLTATSGCGRWPEPQSAHRGDPPQGDDSQGRGRPRHPAKGRSGF